MGRSKHQDLPMRARTIENRNVRLHPSTPTAPKTPRTGKRDRRKRKTTAAGVPAVIDLSLEIDSVTPSVKHPRGDDFIAFSGADELSSPGAGPSRLSSFPSTPLPTYTPTSFTPLSRSTITAIPLRSSQSGSRNASPPEASSRSGDMVTERSRRPVSPAPQVRASRAPSPNMSTEHFEPPDLFFTSLVPSVDEKTGKVELQKPGEIGEAASNEDKLLLPSHVILDSAASRVIDAAPKPDEVEGGLSRGGDSMMEGLHFLGDDVAKDVTRYFDPPSPPRTAEATFLATADQSKICQNCKRPGHRMKDCQHTICMTCGAEDQHERRNCPSALVCFGCGQRGHRQGDCPNPTSRSSRRQGCDRCGHRDHLENSCPSLWRIYSYLNPDARKAIQDDKARAEGWTKEATGGGTREEWCYNCARVGHLGDDCHQRRGSLARLFVPSAFSIAMSTRGPYAGTGSSRFEAPPTHARWDDEGDLPFMSKGFEGDMAGRKTREKERRRLMDRDRGAGEDEQDSFTGPKRSNALSIRGRAMPSQRRLWDSDRRSSIKRDHLPFSHSHLMSPAPASAPAKGIAFGKLVLPADSPTAEKARKPANPAMAMVDRALSRDGPAGKDRQPESPGRSPAPGSSTAKKRRRRVEDRGKDWENEWRASGKGGGPVSGWGKDIDRVERMTKKEAGKVNGQKYTGGY